MDLEVEIGGRNNIDSFATLLAMAPFLDERLLLSEQPCLSNKSAAVKSSPASWTAADFADESAYTYTLSDIETAEVNEAIAYFIAAGFGIDQVTPRTFPLPTLGEALRDFAIELHEGRGLFVLRGLEPDRYTIEENTVIFLGISCYVGGVLGKQTDDGKIRRRISSTETRPLFFHRDGNLISSVLPDALVESPDVKRQAGLPSLTPIQIKALNAIQSLSRKHCVSLPMLKGDILFVNNLSLLHAREAFADSTVNKRYLVRLWLKNEEMAWKLPGVLKRGNEDLYSNTVDGDEEERDWNIIPEPGFRFWVYERQTP
ncbi:uncharacterized protein BDV14DRAFT_194843 [Aspergillus stella-maris]|uniref:uncharacterized protein n=1 Tax=Aspergillus stella-maris TaxID=1810926 RepID=UPI003CCCFB82